VIGNRDDGVTRLPCATDYSGGCDDIDGQSGGGQHGGDSAGRIRLRVTTGFGNPDSLVRGCSNAVPTHGVNPGIDTSLVVTLEDRRK